MSAKRTTKVEMSDKGHVVKVLAGGRRRRMRGKTDWEKLETMSDEEIARAAREDPDAPLLTAKQLKKSYSVPDNVNVSAVRKRLHMSQQVFAYKYGFALDAVQDWEQGRRRPNRSARVLLQVIAREPDAVDRALRGASRGKAAL